MTGYVVLDIETDGLMLPGEAPPPILCAATLCITMTAEDGTFLLHEPIKTWPINIDFTKEPPNTVLEVPSRKMNPEEIMGLVEYLWFYCGHNNGASDQRLRVMGWNAVGFDLQVLYAQCKQFSAEGSLSSEQQLRAKMCMDCLQWLAWDCCDPMLNFFMSKGFPVKLSAVAATLEFPIDKTGHGSEVAEVWKQGTDVQRMEVLMYCANDVFMTAAVASDISTKRHITWITRKGTTAAWMPPRTQSAMAAAHMAYTWKFPDNSWLNKRPRDVQHTAGKLLMQHDNDTEASSTQTPNDMERRPLPTPSNYFGWLADIS